MPLNFYHSIHSLMVKFMLWLLHLTHHYRSMIVWHELLWWLSVSIDAYKLVRSHLLVRSSAPLHLWPLYRQRPCSPVLNAKNVRKISNIFLLKLSFINHVILYGVGGYNIIISYHNALMVEGRIMRRINGFGNVLQVFIFNQLKTLMVICI